MPTMFPAPARSSIAFFANPDNKTIIKSIYGSDLNQPVLAGEYILGRCAEYVTFSNQ
jgi:hypothetical protein